MEPTAPLTVAHPPPRAMMIFDGDCSFCRRWAGRWQSTTGDAIDYEPRCAVEKDFPEISPEAFDKAVQLVETNGTVRSAGDAVLRALFLGGKHRWAWWLYCRVATFAVIVEAAYRYVSRHRGGWMDVADRWLLGKTPGWPSWRVGQWAFLRGMGVVYLIAFVDFWMQADGLIGRQGVLPVAEFLGWIKTNYGAQWHLLPTLCWLNCSDSFVHAMCLSGCIVSVLLILNVLPLGSSIVAWVLYLSLAVAGQVFFQLQWDALLLEAGFLAIFYAPVEPWPRLGRGGEPPWIARWLLRWLLIRLILLSGLVKILSHDGTWTTFTALDYHYMIQPLPPWTAWYMAKEPEWFERASVFFVLAVELLCPVLVLGPRRYRRMGLFGIALLQVLIVATGNYGFFNLLTLVLCLPLLEDDSRFWRWVPMGKRLVARATAPPPPKKTEEITLAWPSWLLAPIAIFLVFLTVVAALGDFGPQSDPPTRLEAIADYFAPYEIANSYGLFRNMTTDRPELIISGSEDGVHWREYQFKFKPGDVGRRPAFCAPSLPRLDWQMWFLALYAEHADPGGWDAKVLVQLMQRLTQESPSVIGLLAYDPFPEHPPKYVRCQLYQYRFTTAAEKQKTGDWWSREDLGETIDTVRRPGAEPLQ
jgi:predicted DCC family thiol-disulfide oxidoreductase YuxK